MVTKAKLKFGTVDREALFVTLEVNEAGEGMYGKRDVRRLSVTGDILRSGHDIGGGQCIDMARRVLAIGQLLISRPQALAIIGIWERWHMNDMRSGCKHQRDFGWTWGEYPSEPCPICGYKCGSAWVAEPLPDYVPEFIATLNGAG